MLRSFRKGSAAPVSDEEITALLASNPDEGWRAFIETYTPTLLALIERTGIADRDEAMEVYTRVCTRLTDHAYEALRRRNPDGGTLAGWLAVVVRRAAVDYVRSRIGRRRLFGAVRDLDREHQRVFELYYWERRGLAEVTEVLRAESNAEVGLEQVLDRLETLDRVLTDRHRADLLALMARSHAPVPLDGPGDDARPPEPAADAPDPEAALHRRETEARLRHALASLAPEDAAIVTLKYGEGLTRTQVQRILRLPSLTEHRVRSIVATLKARLAALEQAPAPAPDAAPRSASHG